MKRTALISLATLCVLGLSACAGTPPTTEATAQPQPTAQAEPATAAPTEAPAPTETATQAPATVEGPTQVQIQLADNTIVSSLTTFRAGTAYTFAISNSGRREHNFTISPPVAVAGGYSEALAQALLAVDETQIPPGNAMKVDFTFPAAAVGADLEFNCLIRRHYDDGMRLAITVTN